MGMLKLADQLSGSWWKWWNTTALAIRRSRCFAGVRIPSPGWIIEQTHSLWRLAGWENSGGSPFGGQAGCRDRRFNKIVNETEESKLVATAHSQIH
jgi:hypothetical protein